MTTQKSITSIPFGLKVVILASLCAALFVQGCGSSQKTEEQKKATQSFYQHSDSKPDPFLQKKDD